MNAGDLLSRRECLTRIFGMAAAAVPTVTGMSATGALAAARSAPVISITLPPAAGLDHPFPIVIRVDGRSVEAPIRSVELVVEGRPFPGLARFEIADRYEAVVECYVRLPHPEELGVKVRTADGVLYRSRCNIALS